MRGSEAADGARGKVIMLATIMQHSTPNRRTERGGRQHDALDEDNMLQTWPTIIGGFTMSYFLLGSYKYCIRRIETADIGRSEVLFILVPSGSTVRDLDKHVD